MDVCELQRGGLDLSARDSEGRPRHPLRWSRCIGVADLHGVGTPRGARAEARASDRAPLPARLPPDPGALDRPPSEPRNAEPRGPFARALHVGVAEELDPVPHGRARQRLVRWNARDQRRVRLGAVGHRLHRAGNVHGSGRRQLPGQSRELHGLFAPLRRLTGTPRRRNPRRTARVVRAAARQGAHRRSPGADDAPSAGSAQRPRASVHVRQREATRAHPRR